MPRRILVVARWYPSHDSPIRGVFVADLVRGLVDAGNEVVVASFETVPLRGLESTRDARSAAARSAWRAAVQDAEAVSSPRSWGAGVPVARLPVVRTWGAADTLDELDRVERHAEMLEAFGTALANRWRFDVIHAHTGAPDGLAAARLADLLRIGLLVSEHDSTITRRLAARPELAGAYRALADPGQGRVVAAVSPALRGAVHRAAGLSGGLEVLPNPVPVDAFPLGDPGGRDPDELLWVGARADHKGTPVLLDAFARVHRDHPSWRLRLVGPSPNGMDERLRRQADELGVGAAVSLEPAADRSGVRDAMQRAGIFVHPSPWETFGMVAAEAIATGLPVAATPSGGVDSIVGDDGRLGVVAADTTADALADTILAVASRRSTYDPAAMRTDIAARFGSARVVAAAAALYDVVSGPVPERGTPSEQTTSPTGERPGVVVGLHPTSLRRLAELPAGTLAGSLLVTAALRAGHNAGAEAEVGAERDAVEADAGRLITIDPTARFRAALAAATGVTGWLRRRQLMNARTDLELEDRRELLRRALQSGAASNSSQDPRADPMILAVDADDVVAILDALPGARLAPGSLRWLADRSDAAGVVMAPSHDALLGV